MKKNKGMLLLAGILIVLLVLYFGLKSWNKTQEEKEEKEESESVIHVTDSDPDEIVALKFDMGHGVLEFARNDDGWYYVTDPDFPLDQSYLEKMASAAGDVTADRELKDGDTMEDYGLDDPTYTIEYTDSQGNTTQIDLGDLTGDYYYATTEGSGKVYTVLNTVIEPFNYQLSALAKLDDYPSIGSGNLVKETITENGNTTVYDSEDEDQEENIAAVAGGLGAVTLSKAADYSVEDSDLAQYGLDEASRITVEAVYTDDDEEKELRLYIGGTDDDGNRYVMINDSRIVYLISDEICNNILNR